MIIDWNKFTNFRSRNTRKDLERLLNGAAKSKSRTKDLLERPDKTGLCPIHWAAINNRPDMIETLYEAGSPLAKPCRNRLFANGTPLHLAAVNGCLEAAAMLLAKSHELQSHETRPKSVASSESSQRDENNNNKDLEESEEETNKLLETRDAEGQTPLMRAAAPRSKRMDAIRDLLRKNFWSLSGRPAEMALFLICMGAEWRYTEPAMGMNLLHLAIVNDYDDIVSLLLALDLSLIDTPTMSTTTNRSPGEPTTTDDESRGSESASPATSPDRQGAGGTKPLIDSRRERADELLAAGLKPLQLAILYGRVSSISQLWHASQDLQKRPPANSTGTAKKTTTTTPSHVEAQIEAFKNERQSPGQRELKRTLMRACYTNKQELAKFLKPGLLKGALALDLAILALVWAPTYVTFNGFAGGVFIISYVISMALGLRVMLKNPGYLRRNSVQYLSELARLMQGRRRRRAKQSREEESHPSQQNSQSEESRTRDNQAIERRKSTPPLIKLEPPPDISRDQTTAHKEKEREGAKQIATTNDNQKPHVVSIASARMSVNAFRELQDKARLFCHKCQCIRRPRSRHCNSCNHCVQDFDHHCIYLGCCVGRYNRLDFLLALIALSITAIYGTILHSIAIDKGGRGILLHAIGVVWIGKYVLIGGLSAFLNARRACLGITQYEEVRSKRIRRTFGRVGPPEEISNSHQEFSTHRNAFWRYAPDRFLTGELTTSQLLANLREFTNYLALDEYLLTFICTDTPLARSLTSSDWRMKQLYKFV